MYSKIAVGSALVAAVAAVPMVAQEKRDIVWFTQTEVDVVTVPVTTTIWVDGTDSVTSVAHFGHHTHSTSHVTSYVTVPASSSPSSSAAAPSSSAIESSPSSTYVAPTPSSTYVAPSSSSVYVAPSSSSVYVVPTTPSSTYVAPSSTYVPSSTSAAAPASSSSTSSSSGSGLTYGMAKSGTSYEGDMTYYATGLGACGWTNYISDKIAAVSYDIFDSYDAEEGEGGSNSNPVCGKTVTITGVDGNPYVATIVDRCPGCDSGSLDLSQDFFNNVTSNGDGRVHNVKWVWN